MTKPRNAPLNFSIDAVVAALPATAAAIMRVAKEIEMAVAGNMARQSSPTTLDVIMLRVDNGKLTQVGGKHRIAGHLACDPAKAIRELRAGRSCCLKLYGDNKAQVMAAFSPVSEGK